LVAQLKDKGVVSRGWIGVQFQPFTAETAENLGMKGSEGASVAEPQAGSPAAKAGIDSGDVITAVNGHAVKDARDLGRQVGAMAPGSEAKLSVWRKGEEKIERWPFHAGPPDHYVRLSSLLDLSVSQSGMLHAYARRTAERARCACDGYAGFQPDRQRCAKARSDARSCRTGRWQRARGWW
jgi:hypothetical protein